MPDEKTIKNYSAADIEKYWNKKLSPSEMHEMEKAAMDDPFFADALEGYRYSKNADEELRVLRGRFDKKFDTAAPVIPIQRKNYAWLKVAAAIIVLMGTGLLIQQLVIKSKNETTIAKADDVKEQKAVEPTTTNAGVASNSTDVTRTDSVSDRTNAVVGNLSTPVKEEKKETFSVDLNSTPAYVTVDSVGTNVRREQESIKGDVASQKNEEAVTKQAQKKEVLNQKAVAAKPNAVDSARFGLLDVDDIAAPKRKSEVQGFAQYRPSNNTFNYRVVDNQNNPIPFANVLNTRDNIGTYSDVRGYFNLVSPDSVLDVQVRSLGFNPENYRLVPSKQPNNLILKEDATARMAMDSYEAPRVMPSVTRKDSAEVEEPVVGWGNYNTYVENNIKIPENVRAKNALGEVVELSFDVDKTGTPINIKVTKSSQCKECDEEAKRLLKEGPKWKRKGKKYKTTISIAVDQK